MGNTLVIGEHDEDYDVCGRPYLRGYRTWAGIYGGELDFARGP